MESLHKNTRFKVVPKHGNVLGENIPSEVKLDFIRGKWRPVEHDGSDFLGKNFDGLYRSENLVVSFDRIFDQDLGELTFGVSYFSPECVFQKIQEEYILIPKK